MGTPLMHTTLREHVRLLSSIVPSDIWVRRFLCRHATTIIAAKAQGLDPKWAKAFNPSTVAGHFQLLGKAFETYKVKQEHVYNVDKKGLQLGGWWNVVTIAKQPN